MLLFLFLETTISIPNHVSKILSTVGIDSSCRGFDVAISSSLNTNTRYYIVGVTGGITIEIFELLNLK